MAQRLCSGWLSDLQGSLGIKTYDSHPGAPSRAKESTDCRLTSMINERDEGERVINHGV